MTARQVGGHTEIDEADVRQGQTGLHVRYVLAFSTLLVALGIGLAALFAGAVW